MTLTLPPDLADLVAKAGGRWPQADEDQLHDLSGKWTAMAGELRSLKSGSSPAAQLVRTQNQGASIDSFGSLWAQFEQQLDASIAAVEGTATAVRSMASAVFAAKKAIAQGAASVYGKILEIRRLAGMSGGIICAVGRLLLPLLRWLWKYIWQVLRWLLTWIWKGIVWLFRTIAGWIAGAYEWFRKLFKGKKGNQPGGKNKPPGHGGKKPHRELTPQERQELDRHRNDLAAKDPQRYSDYQKDPDHRRRDGTYDIDDNARAEAKTGLDLRERGYLPSDLQRPQGRGQGDFYSPSTGKYYDLKEVDPSPNFNVNNFENKIGNMFNKNREVVVDLRNAPQSHINQIQQMAARRGWQNRIVWYP
ncbi:hypothetical protein E1264_22735 [Actinomadura sp. KC216]|uniref:WXG100 family type VII secretion target n=1 Tax=Actinomadura sp. KC216 TaxID=2530370 RepID=UPI001046390C|nr:hypothetical protein [Actinomadura sp. KC216]TDB84978.1 hypothetical protein E1264_22735 [Actinomadura sp. KC216]